MKTLSFLFLTAFLALPVVASASATEDIQNTYDQLDEAILEENGKAAFSVLSEESQQTIEKVRKLALSADKATLMKESLPVILSVFSVRTESQGNPPANGPETLILMSADYARSSSVSEMGEITVDGDTAKAEMLVNGNPTGMNFSYIKENGNWKVDMAQQLKDTETMMKENLPGGMGMEMIVNQMAAASQRQGVDVWKPLQP